MFEPQWRLEPPNCSYSPEQIDLTQEAFDQAWAMHEPAFAHHDGKEAAREVLAKAILEIVAHGERDAGKVKNYGLSELLRFRNS